jgi:hypothetical protein
MDVIHSDGRVFENTDPHSDFMGDYEPGDVAWFEEDILLVARVENGTAYAIEHPAAEEMMAAALYFGAKGSDRVNHGMVEAMRIHARTMAKGWLAARAAGLLATEPHDLTPDEVERYRHRPGPRQAAAK